MNSAEDRVFGFLLTFIGSIKQNELRQFLRFVTGSSELLAKQILVSFNSLTGLARRPISHTCDCQIELPVSYATYPEFESEFMKVLASELSWEMDASKPSHFMNSSVALNRPRPFDPVILLCLLVACNSSSCNSSSLIMMV